MCGYLYFDGLEFIIHYHILEIINKIEKYQIKKPKTFKFSEFDEMCSFINEILKDFILNDCLIGTNINYSENIEFFNLINHKLNDTLFSHTKQFEKSSFLVNSLFFLNNKTSNHELIYDNKSIEYYNRLFTRDNIQNDCYKLIGAIHYFNFTFFCKL